MATTRLTSPGARVALVSYKGRARRVDALLANAAADREELSRRVAQLTAIRAEIAAVLGRQW